MVLTLKKRKDNKKTMQIISVLIIIIFVSSVFIIFVQDNTIETQKTFYVKLQVKDYSNPIQGDVVFIEGYNLSDILISYNIFINETCINLDYLYCNEGNYSWNLYINGETGESINYYPKDNDQIIFKYEKI